VYEISTQCVFSGQSAVYIQYVRLQLYQTSHLLLLFVAYYIRHVLGVNHSSQFTMECCIHFEKGGSEYDPAVLTFSQKSTEIQQHKWTHVTDIDGTNEIVMDAQNSGFCGVEWR